MANVLSWRVGGWRGCKGRYGNGFIFYIKGKDEDAGRGSRQINEASRAGM